MTDYSVKYTDKNKAPIVISETNVDNSTTDISLFGRKRLEYGRDMNANFLHILENFACEENPLLPGNPDLTKSSYIADTTKRLLSTPTQGQLWFNITQESLFVWNGLAWTALGMIGDIAANWGVIAHGSQLPRPVNQNGYVFEYEECSWIVSPFVFDTTFTYMQCLTDEEANVTMFYDPEGGGATIYGCANYLIVGIKGNVNLGTQLPIPSATPAPSPTPTVTPTMTSTPVVSPTPSITPTAGVTATPTPTVTTTPSATPAATPSPSAVIYSLAIAASPTGAVLPGGTICYTMTLNAPAPPGGYSFTFIRSGDFTSVCASTNGETVGPVIESLPTSIPSGDNSLVICRAAPLPPTPTPTPTATMRTACKTTPGQIGAAGTYFHGYLCANSPGGSLVYFTNATNNYTQCTTETACNNATSFSSTSTININPVRESVQRYNATPCFRLQLRITIAGIGETFIQYNVAGTSVQSFSDIVAVGSRTFTVAMNMTPTLLSSSGSNRTWTIVSDYTVTDNELGTVIGFC